MDIYTRIDTQIYIYINVVICLPLYSKGITQSLTIETANSFHMLLLNKTFLLSVTLLI